MRPTLPSSVTRSALCLGIAWLAISACGGDTVQEVVPSIRVRATHVDEANKPLLDFGPVPVLIAETLLLEIENVGRADLRIEDLRIETEGETFFLREALETELIPGGTSIEVPVSFRPPAVDDFEGVLIVQSNDRRNPEVRVAMEGSGSTVGAVAYDPDELDFGIVGEWTQETRTLRLRSVGTAPLLIEAARLSEDTDPAFQIVGSTREVRLPPPQDGLPGGEVALSVSCSPTGVTEGEEIGGTLHLTTTDPKRREIAIPLIARINRAPIAEFSIGVENRVAYGAVQLDATASHDPDGHEPLSYVWRVHRQPAGATVDFSDPTSPTPTFTTDTPGEYVIGLDVEDALGLPCYPPDGELLSPCATQTMQIRSEDDIVIQVSWNKGTDLDLHLLEEGEALYGERDCFWANTQPDFGEPGPADDPRFVRETLQGPGAEDIFFSRPSPGRYEVAVVFDNAHEEIRNPETTATLKVYVFGELAAERTKVLPYPGVVWRALTIEWPSQDIETIDIIDDLSANEVGAP